jgi:RNA polymerase sigma factor (sigma-70 family)
MAATVGESLGARLHNGDQSVLQAILRDHGPPVAKYLLFRYPGRLQTHDVDDALNIALYRLWTHRNAFNPSRNLRRWFGRIVINAARDIMKSNLAGARPRYIVDPSRRDDDSGRRPRVDSHRSTNGPDLMAIHDALERLPAIQRRIVMADACTPHGTACSRTLAEELAVRPATVREYRRRALRRLRRALEGAVIGTAVQCDDES